MGATRVELPLDCSSLALLHTGLNHFTHTNRVRLQHFWWQMVVKQQSSIEQLVRCAL